MLVGENGVVSKAQDSKKRTEDSSVQEAVDMALGAMTAEFMGDVWSSNTGAKIGDWATVKKFKEELANNGYELDVSRISDINNALLKDNNELNIYKEGSSANKKTFLISESSDGTSLEGEIAIWTQTGTSVTNGTVNLTVGQAVTGYSVTGHAYLKWYVLGAKDGKLLITTNTCPETVNLAGTAGFTNADGKGCPWVTTLNTAAANYSDGDMADSTRTIDFDDIKRIAPNLVNSNVGEVYEYGNKVTYTLKASSSNVSNKVIWYRGKKQPTVETETSETSFQYWGKNSSNQLDWISLGDEESVALDCTLVSYNASSIDSSAKTLLFTNTGMYPGATGSYWLGSPIVYCREGYARFGLLFVCSKDVSLETLFDSDNDSYSSSMGLRPVVSLKSEVNVTSDGAISID